MPAYFEAGKGSLQRPEDHKKFSDNWDLIFGKKNKPEEETTSMEGTDLQDEKPE